MQFSSLWITGIQLWVTLLIITKKPISNEEAIKKIIEKNEFELLQLYVYVHGSTFFKNTSNGTYLFVTIK